MNPLLLAIGLATPDASAAYVCGLTSTQISTALTYYSSSIPLAMALDTLEAPFECANFGDLCSEVGQDRAEEFVCDRWYDAVAQKSAAVIQANGDADLVLMSEAWEAERWPQGIPDTSPAWGTLLDSTDPAPTTCERIVTRKNSTDTLRTRGKSYWILTVVYNQLGGSTKGYFYDTSSSRWKIQDPRVVVVSGTVSKTGCSDSIYDTDNDGWVADAAWGVFAFPYKHVNATHTGSPTISTFPTCNTAPWGGSCL
jgi:hypothetical protein